MFGLGLEKLLVLAVLAAFILGPSRLPGYARRLGELVRTLRDLLDTTRERARTEIAGDLSADEWRRLDPRRYDPRSIIRDALAVDGDPATPVSDLTAPAAPAAGHAAPPSPVRTRPRYDSAGRVIRTPA